MLHELQMYQSEILEDRHNKFFDGRKRKVQVQFNVRFKRSPEGTLWLGSELPEQPPSKSKLKLRGVNNMASWFAKLLGKDKCHFAVLTEGTQQKLMWPTEEEHVVLTPRAIWSAGCLSSCGCPSAELWQ